MNFRMERHGDKLLVHIADVTGEERGVFERICGCRSSSWWSCPSGECAKIGACDTQREGESTVLALTPRPGETLSTAGIEECLRYVLADAGGAATAKATPPAR